MTKPSREPVDRVFLFLILAELAFGLVMLASASGPLSYSRLHTSWYYVLHQLYSGVLPGLVAMWLVSRIDHRLFEKLALPIFISGLAALALVFVPGVAASYGTSKSWLMIGGWFSFQPIEYFKLALIIYLAALFAKDGGEPKKILFPSLVALGAGAILLMLQPDLGGLVLITAVFAVILFAAGIPYSYFLGIIAAGGAALFFFAKNAAYRAARLMVFLHPELDPKGVGYQINQALLAIGSGGFWGLGLGHSRQKYSYLPEVMNDSIFPIIAEELGFIFSLALIALITAIFVRGVKIARARDDRFGRLAVIGIASWLFIQSAFNIGAMLGLLPLTGVPLPFVSYGGTAMILNLCAVGVALSISRGTARA